MAERVATVNVGTQLEAILCTAASFHDSPRNGKKAGLYCSWGPRLACLQSEIKQTVPISCTLLRGSKLAKKETWKGFLVAIFALSGFSES